MKTLVALSVMVIGLTASTSVQAFHGSKSFELSANKGGGGGIFFTGASRWKRYDCTICHAGDSGGVSVRVTSSPPDLLASGMWESGRTYEIAVELLGESRGFQAGANINTFVAEFTDTKGQPVGTYEFDATELATWDNGHVIGAKGNPDRAQWSFRFTAPPAGTGSIALDVAMVDGNGAGVAPSRASDMLGDGVATAHLDLCESGAPCTDATAQPPRSDESAAAGCSTSSGTPGGALWLILLGMVTARRRRHRASRAACRDVPEEIPLPHR